MSSGDLLMKSFREKRAEPRQPSKSRRPIRDDVDAARTRLHKRLAVLLVIGLLVTAFGIAYATSGANGTEKGRKFSKNSNATNTRLARGKGE